MDFLTGTGLAASAGLNAYIPLLAMGLLDRYSQAVDLGPGFAWLSNGWVLLILAVLLVLEIVADKIPAVDSVNDIIQTFVRPTSGGIVFGSTAVSNIAGFNVGGEQTVTDPEAFVQSGTWLPIVVGIVIALTVHGVKTASRPVVNTASAGLGAPVVSTVEDAGAIVMSIAAIFLPVLVLVFVVLLTFAAFWVFSRLKKIKNRRRSAQGI